MKKENSDNVNPANFKTRQKYKLEILEPNQYNRNALAHPKKRNKK